MIKSSLGPVGLDKMIVSANGEVMVTNDGATILQQLMVEHPAGKVLVDLARLQDQEVGDGTTSVVILAAELLKRASVLIEHDVHPQTIIGGYALAAREAARYIETELRVPVASLGPDALKELARTTLASKVLGGGDAAFFAAMCVEAVQRVAPAGGAGRYNIDSINILKSCGGSSRESLLVKGYALNCTRASPAMPLAVRDAKIACIDFSLRKDKLSMGYQVVVQDTSQLEAIRDRESDLVTEKIKMILATGCNVLFSTKGIDDVALKYFVEAGCLAVRRVAKDDLKRIARATGASVVLSMAELEGGAEFSASYLGKAEHVSQERVADDELIFVRGTQHPNSASIVFRGPNTTMLDEMERAMHDALSAVARTLESGHVVAGGGAVEAALNIYVESLAMGMGSRQQLAVAEFAAALLVIPRILAMNGAHDAVDLVAKLRALHNKAQSDAASKELKYTGLDLELGVTRNNLRAGVLEPSQNKIRAIQFAVEAAITILRIDDVFKLDQKVNPKNADPHGHGH